MGQPTRVALVLGGGGARGYAHIGAIEILQERGYEIVTIAGTSMGALVGGLHAAGALDEYTQWARTLTQRDVLRLLDPALRGPGAIRATKIFAKVSELLGDVLIEDLPIPYTAVATDLIAAKEVWFQRGPLAPAIRASIALPSFITPVMLGGRLLADGGLMNPIPVAATAATNADVTIAVSLAEEDLLGGNNAVMNESSDPTEIDGQRVGRDASQLLDTDLVRTVTGWFSGARDTPTAVEETSIDALDDTKVPIENGPGFEAPPAGLRTVEVMQLSLNALQGAVARFRLAGYPPDVLVTIPRTAARTLDFHRADEMIALGRERTIAALDRDNSLPWGP